MLLFDGSAIKPGVVRQCFFEKTLQDAFYFVCLLKLSPRASLSVFNGKSPGYEMSFYKYCFDSQLVCFDPQLPRSCVDDQANER